MATFVEYNLQIVTWCLLNFYDEFVQLSLGRFDRKCLRNCFVFMSCKFVMYY